MSARTMLASLMVLTLTGAVAADEQEVVLERIISREHAEYQNVPATLRVGRDGMVYLRSPSVSHRGGHGFILRCAPDGSDRVGFMAGPIATIAVANADGVIGVTAPHMQRMFRLFDPSGEPVGTVRGFLGNDQVGWDSPSGVDVGPGGDFFVVDQHRHRVLRIRPPEREVRAYGFPAMTEERHVIVDEMRASEETEQILLDARGMGLLAVGFDGEVRWRRGFQIHGGWDLDDQGTLYGIHPHGQTDGEGRLIVHTLSADGQTEGRVLLEAGDLRPSEAYPAGGLGVHDGKLFLRRQHPTEMFQVYDMESGQLVHAVPLDHERLTVRYDSAVWPAGEEVEVSIDYAPHGHLGDPAWRIWARPLASPDFVELVRENGRVRVPEDWAGLYVLNISPEVNPRGEEMQYGVRSIIEVRRPDAVGTVTVLTPGARLWYGRGEAIAGSVLIRGELEDTPEQLVLELVQEDRVIARGELEAPQADEQGELAPIAFEVPAELTAALLPGEYQLTVRSAGDAVLTEVAQPLRIGPGMPEHDRFFHVLYGDYAMMYPRDAPVSFLNAPERVAGFVDRYHRLGFNFTVSRIGMTQRDVHQWLNNPAQIGEFQRLQERLEAGVGGGGGVPPEHGQLAPPLRQTMGAFSAAGIHKMSVLMHMDAGLPIGTGHDLRPPEVLREIVEQVTAGLLPYAAFRGWSWAANWWIWDNSLLFENDEERAAHGAALARARETGEWDEILDTIAERSYAWQTDAQAMFREAMLEASLRGVQADRLVSASSGPYRRIEAHPPAVFANVDEVDAHYQAEQIQPPLVTPHAVDSQRLHGKRIWSHPETFNDDGTGGQVFPTLLLPVMRGVDGTGTNNLLPQWGPRRADPRSAYLATDSTHRAAHGLMADYGRLLADLENADQVGIIVCRRMANIQGMRGYRGVGGEYFTRLFEAYQACLYAHHPARFIFSEEIEAGHQDLSDYKALLVVGQRVEMALELEDALRTAQEAGVAVFHDETCRAEVVMGFQPLGISFDLVTHDPSVWQDDHAYWRFVKYFRGHAPALREHLDPLAARAVEMDAEDVLASRRRSGVGEYVILVNHTRPVEMSPGQFWRLNLAISQLVPAHVEARIVPEGEQVGAVYDVMAMRRVTPEDGRVEVDLRTTPMRVFAILPTAIEAVSLGVPAEAGAGQAIRWEVRVLDEDGAGIDTLVPVRVELLDGDGEAIQSAVLSVGEEGVEGEWVLPLNLTDDVMLRAKELLSGRVVSRAVAVRPAELPVALLDGLAMEPAGVGEAVRSAEAELQEAAAEDLFGPRLRDMALLADGTAVINAFNWDQNLYGIDTASGEVRWRGRIGHHWAYAPQAAGEGMVVAGFDLASPEGYHVYLADSEGDVQRRFALPGLPKRGTNWAFAAIRDDRNLQFAAAPDGSWIAGSGDLALAVWSADGELLWSMDRTSRDGDGRVAHPVMASGDDELIVMAGRTVTAYGARDGAERWSVELSDHGRVHEGALSVDGRTLAFLASSDAGRTFIIRDGEVIASFPTTNAQHIALSPDGEQLVAVEGAVLSSYSVQRGLEWVFSGDDRLVFPRFDSAGERLAVSSILGSVHILAADGRQLLERDMGSLAVPAWLGADGRDDHLLIITWSGGVIRLDDEYNEVWRRQLDPGDDVNAAAAAMAERISPAASGIPTARLEGWQTATPQPRDIADNVLARSDARIEHRLGDRTSRPFQNDPAMLTDGNTDPPAAPWIPWTDIGFTESGWVGGFSLVIDAGESMLRVEALTLAEDPDHPESWVRDALFQYWDEANEQWVTSMNLLADAPLHSHELPEPVQSTRFRLIGSPTPGSWPVGNLRLAEIAFHGEVVERGEPAEAAGAGR